MLVASGSNFFAGRAEANTALFSGTLYLAVSTDATAPNAADTVISGEQTANGLARKAVAVTHTNGTKVWIFAAAFTYTGSATVNIQKIALFDAAAGGNLLTEDVIAGAQFAASGDNGSFSVTFTLG